LQSRSRSWNRGGEVILIQDAVPEAKLVPIPRKARKARTFGEYRGKIEIADDFDAPLPESFWLGGGR
jgi:antitoxin (DNA-binding transcriptional repressor) of toxin-antitoxin stability system